MLYDCGLDTRFARSARSVHRTNPHKEDAPMQRPSLMKFSTRALLTLALSCGIAATLLAHHGWSEYDATKTLTLTGTIKESGYDNPHGFVNLDVPAPNAKVWHAVLAPPSRMDARGLTKDALKPGTTATVVGYPHKTKPEEMRAERITVGGKTVELR
jgi:hypothetical protein